MLVVIDLAPMHGKARAVCAEYRMRGIFHVALGVVSDALDDGILIVTRLVAVRNAEESALSARVGDHLFCVIEKGRNGASTAYRGTFGIRGFGRKVRKARLQV